MMISKEISIEELVEHIPESIGFLMKEGIKSKWAARAGIISLGAAAGYAYYYFIGCASGTCLITSNPWISTLYGAVLGFLLIRRD